MTAGASTSLRAWPRLRGDDWAETRGYLRDPDGYLIEVGKATGMLEGICAAPPADAGQ